MIGEKLNQYEIKSVLGEGGMATVYLAFDTNFQIQVAVKVLKKEFVFNTNVRKRFIAEAKSMRKMDHHQIIKVTDLIDAGDIVAFVMEYINGQTVKELVAEKKVLNDKEIKDVLFQMLDSLKYVHAKGLIHRDVKPSNFLITANGKVKLTDFGIAKSTDPNSSEYTMTGTSQQMGTPSYMSPEQITSTKAVTKQTDIYSLGVLLWFMLTNRKPYDENSLSFFQMQMEIVQTPLPNTGTSWDEIIGLATKKNVTERFKNTDDFKKAVISHSSRPKAKPKKNRKLVLVLLFALTIISGVSYVQFKRGDEPLKKEVQVIENDNAGSEEEIISDKKDASETKTTSIERPVLGDYVQGGVVFHVEDDYFLVSGIEDLSHNSPWSSKNIRIGNTQEELGTGNANTNAIIKAHGLNPKNSVAAKAIQYQFEGYADWFLPSEFELDRMFKKRGTINSVSKQNGGDRFNPTLCYYSSTEYNTNNKISVCFGAGLSGYSTKSDKIDAIRPIRQVCYTSEEVGQIKLIQCDESKNRERLILSLKNDDISTEFEEDDPQIAEVSKPPPAPAKKLYTTNKLLENDGQSTIFLKSISLDKNYTILKFEFKNFENGYGWVSIDKNTYIVDKSNGKKLRLISTSGVEKTPNRTTINGEQLVRFELKFPRVSSNCKAIDFIENTDSDWKYYNIKLTNNYNPKLLVKKNFGVDSWIGYDPDGWQFKITNIELNQYYTTIEFYYKCNYSDSWFNMDPKAYILDRYTGKKLSLISMDKRVVPSPQKKPVRKGDYGYFKLKFPRVSVNCRAIDFIENQTSSWQQKNIKLE